MTNPAESPLAYTDACRNASILQTPEATVIQAAVRLRAPRNSMHVDRESSASVDPNDQSNQHPLTFRPFVQTSTPVQHGTTAGTVTTNAYTPALDFA